MIAIYPREGTETVSMLLMAQGMTDCNLSPRGDGNPAIWTNLMLVRIAIYPREGTET